MLHTVCIALLLPLLGSLVLMITSDFIERKGAGIIACTSVLLSFFCFAGLLYSYIATGMDQQNCTFFQWISFKQIQVDFNLYLDTLSLLMALIITGVGFLIHVYSMGYMEHDEDYARYFACLNFFIFAMLLLVLAGNLLVLFVGWEGVGLASYLLIGFWYHRPAAAQAATKAFVVNRIGDLGLLLGLILTFQLFGTGEINQVSEKAAQGFAIGAPLLTLLTFLYFWGATGKSAQIPLYTWLPDAMEGPTPVSALIHAATMVTAGVYLVVRMHRLFLLTPSTLDLVGDIGAATALVAALSALAQTDLKRVLAYSTVSQLGLMFLACGVGAFYAAMFHLTMHAFVKALLFLAAGNVVHALNGSTNMEKMGGLAKKLTKTHWLFLIGVLALSGIPPFSAFFSKELILEQEYLAGFKTLFFIGLITSILTAFYLTRAYCMTFLGTPRLEEKILKTVHEAPKIMLTPVMILAALSILGGLLGFAVGHMPILETFLAKSDVTLPKEELTGFHLTPETWLAMLGTFLGFGAAIVLYTRFYNPALKPLPVLKQSFFINEIYDNLFVRPLKALSISIVHIFEPKVFEGSIQATAHMAQGAAQKLQQMQSGQIRSYIAWVVIGATLLMIYFFFEGLHA